MALVERGLQRREPHPGEVSVTIDLWRSAAETIACLRRNIPEVETTGLAPRVLVIGLDPYRVPGPWDPRPVADAIGVGMARFAEHGVGAQSCLVGLDGSDDIEAVVTAGLRAEPWECVVIGGGLRHENQLNLFEQVINLVRRHAPAAAIAFNSTPADTLDAAARWIDA